MLTPEQTRLRLQDAELSALKKENARLNAKLAGIRESFAEYLRKIAKAMPWRSRMEFEEMARELEDA